MDEFEGISEEALKRMFFSAIKTLDNIPHYEEMIDCLPLEKRAAIRHQCRQFENEFHERVFQTLLPEISPAAIGQFIDNMTPYGDIPENFREIMLLSPDNPQNYVESQRIGDKDRFGPNDIEEHH